MRLYQFFIFIRKNRTVWAKKMLFLHVFCLSETNHAKACVKRSIFNKFTNMVNNCKYNSKKNWKTLKTRENVKKHIKTAVICTKCQIWDYPNFSYIYKKVEFYEKKRSFCLFFVFRKHNTCQTQYFQQVQQYGSQFEI